MKRLVLAAVMAALAATASPAREAVDAYDGLPAPRLTENRRCTDDGRSCIEAATYVADVCTTIERAATDNRLDPHFLARLLWKESLFEPDAVSRAGALGIAQFMPETARIRKLDDPFNPAKAIHASANYLSYLSQGFGNLGLAAVAYNGGEGRAQRFTLGGNVLPFETQDYVEAITGVNAWGWRDNPPGTVDLRLDKERPFRDACIQLAANRTLKEFGTPERVWPWGVILASHPSQSGAQSQVSRLNRQLRPILGGKRISYVRKSLTGNQRKVYTAQVGYPSRIEAAAFCNQLKSLGGRCIVLRN
ncbi:lytic transglycosylase domain-containing protein [Paracoccus sp. Z118]|uniref:lytic transglycosylase domain-containing protein n=1 Tax=Paracoccus sp. Z118 TaxID=2851017 RepID=UPI001C2B90B4|nr:lytic transglycosylase domain-containing protein [Paracoccus sp. Z118]MBV0891302.1 lytic transglycosylase domain-containing protein [Paracoccus sp. Z118]